MKALRIPARGTIGLVELPDGEGRLAALQAAVGGPIEFVRLGPDAGLLVDEEGLLRPDAEANPVATALRAYWTGMGGYPLTGTALLVGDAGSEFTDVPESYLEPFNRRD